MLATVLAVFAFQQASVTIESGSKGTFLKVSAHESDSTRKKRDSTKAKRRSIAVTEAEMASAFADAGARGLLARARAARVSKDSSITSYDASTLQRLTIGLAVTKWGRERIAFRSEGAS